MVSNAIGNADSLLPMEVLPVVILLEERKKFDQLQPGLRRGDYGENLAYGTGEFDDSDLLHPM